MSEMDDRLAAFQQLLESEGGKILKAWIQDTSNEKRKSASKSEATAYGDLRFADGMDYVLTHIETMASTARKRLP